MLLDREAWFDRRTKKLIVTWQKDPVSRKPGAGRKVETGSGARTMRTPGHQRQRQNRMIANHPERLKRLVQTAVTDAVKRGLLTRPDVCERCNSGDNIQAAHVTYLRPFDVQWLCVPCHREFDKGRTYPEFAPKIPTPKDLFGPKH